MVYNQHFGADRKSLAAQNERYVYRKNKECNLSFMTFPGWVKLERIL